MSTNDREGDHQSDTPYSAIRNINRYLLNLKSNCNIVTCNVQTKYSPTKTTHVINEMENYKLDILGINERRWTYSGRIITKSETGESYTIIYSGQHDTHHRGVALIMNKQHISEVGAHQ